MDAAGYEEKYGREGLAEYMAGSRRVSRKRKFGQVEFENPPQMTRDRRAFIGPSLPPGFVRKPGTQCLRIVTRQKQLRVFVKENTDSRLNVTPSLHYLQLGAIELHSHHEDG